MPRRQQYFGTAAERFREPPQYERQRRKHMQMCYEKNRINNLEVDLEIDDSKIWRTAEIRRWGIAGSDG
jgi:hypothetical protein